MRLLKIGFVLKICAMAAVAATVQVTDATSLNSYSYAWPAGEPTSSGYSVNPVGMPGGATLEISSIGAQFFPTDGSVLGSGAGRCSECQ
jgi:hypothetical protein